MKIDSEKWNFHWEKWNFEPVGDSVHTTEYLAFLGSNLLARLYVTVKMQITNLLSV